MDKTDREEILKQATARYYGDPVFHTIVEYSIMHMFSKVVIPGKHNELREGARIGASCALIMAEKEREEAEQREVTDSSTLASKLRQTSLGRPLREYNLLHEAATRIEYLENQRNIADLGSALWAPILQPFVDVAVDNDRLIQTLQAVSGLTISQIIEKFQRGEYRGE